MHELGITQTIVAIACDHAKGAKVRRVSVEIGKFSGVLADAIAFCFDVCCQGTELAGATLEIIEIPGLARCRHCGTEVPLEYPLGICNCGSFDLELIQGQELRVKELELEDICV
jgi:hydrogenase nickel incorporation protein HypA/HybF